jgi:hypothetical protein
MSAFPTGAELALILALFVGVIAALVIPAAQGMRR